MNPWLRNRASNKAFSVLTPGFSYQLILRKLGSRPYPASLNALGIGVLAFAGSAALGLSLGIPEPSAHDEFSYLLAADTFAHGRLTNPTHPMWMHFETFHVIHQPTYMSKYMPAQGLFLALGRVVGGHPIVGVWFAMAFMCAAICWMLQAWLPRRWALFGSLLTIIHPYVGIGSYWAQSYWGGAVPAAGGALLLGGVRSIVRMPRISYALATGIGLAILANSRPYEGLVISVPLGIGLLIKLFGQSKHSIGVIIKRVLLPLTLLGAITVACMGYYNYRVAGNVLRIPYLVHEETYGMFAYFVWQKLPLPPTYRHTVIRDYHAQYELPRYLEKQSIAGFFEVNFSILFTYLLVSGNVFLVALVGAGGSFPAFCWRDSSGRFAFLTYIFFACGLMLETVMSLHYWAPITGLNYFFITQSMRLWRARDRRAAQLAIYILPLLALALLAINAYRSAHAHDHFAWHLQRARLLTELSNSDGRHLILVQYGPNHSYDREWVYNDADIDASKVVWARDMDPKENCKLVKYFNDRTIWSLKIDNDEAPIKLNPFPKQSCD